jgi:MFS transporter, MHS family, proline/betaine transporter
MSLTKVGAVICGNALEWYDFTIYAYLADTISKMFFPSDERWVPLLSAFATFGVAYCVRPFGGLILAHVADIYGRKSALVAGIALMVTGTGMIAAAPSYAVIGIAAPVIMVVARCFQGLSAGSEFGTAGSFLVECGPTSRRGFWGAWQFSGQGAAVFLSGLICAILVQELTPEQMDSWGWRCPFLVGLLLGPLGIAIRARLQESSVFIDRGTWSASRSPLPSVLADYKSKVVIGLALVGGGTAMFYTLLVFMPTYVLTALQLPRETAFAAPIVSGCVLMLFCPVMGWYSDRIGRKKTMIAAAALAIVLLAPGFVWLNTEPSTARVVGLAIFFGLVFAGYAAPFTAVLADLFPVTARATGLSMAYNLGVMLFGGFSPMIAAWLIATTGDRLAPCYYVIVCISLSIAALAVLAIKGEHASQGSDKMAAAEAPQAHDRSHISERS